MVPPNKTSRLQLLVSFATSDQALKDHLVTHLKVLTNFAGIDLWSVERITAGDDWHTGIARALARADLALLLISADFLASRFLQNVEVPTLFQRRARDGLKVIPVLLRSCHWDVVPWLANLAVLPKDRTPIAALENDKIDQAFADIAAEIVRQMDRARPPADASSSTMSEPDAILELVAAITAEQLGVFPEEVVASAFFVDDLKADSLNLVEIVCALEETFGISIPDEDKERLRRVSDVRDYLIRRGIQTRIAELTASTMRSDPERRRIIHRRQGSRVLRQFAQTPFFELYCRSFGWESFQLSRELAAVVAGRPVHKLTSFPAQSIDENGDFRTEADGTYLLDEVLIVIVSRPSITFCTLDKKGLHDQSYACVDVGIHRTKSRDSTVKVVFEDRRGSREIWSATCRGEAVVATADKVIAELHQVLQEPHVTTI